MSKPNRKRNRNHNHRQDVAPVTSQPVSSPYSKEEKGEPIGELLFKPVIYGSSRSERTIDFEHINVPFLIKDNLVFMLMFMDSCGDLSVYTECYEADPKEPLGSYRDGMQLMRQCLEIEQQTGVAYYFGKLDNALKHYLYAMQLLVDKGFLSRGQAVEIVKELGVEADDMEQASQTVGDDIKESIIRNERMRGEARARANAGSIMTRFLRDILGRNSEEAPDEEDQAGEEHEETV